MPITGYRAGDQCKMCTRDRTECGNCKYLRVDRRQQDRRETDEVDNFMHLERWDRGVEAPLEAPHQPSSASSGTI